MLRSRQVASLEPAVVCAASCCRPSTGIIDVHELLLALLADLEAHGGALLLQANVVRCRRTRHR
jgi:L-2-hydroxyglutarate oxidase LhgO